MFCNIESDMVFESRDADDIYRIPLLYAEQGLDQALIRKMDLPMRVPALDEWKKMMDIIDNLQETITIGIVGKYIDLQDSYMSISESLRHAAIANNVKLEIKKIDSEEITADNVEELLSGLPGILIPGGFGSRGIDGKILAAKFARENKIPYFGICLGMQIALIEFSRNVCGLENAHSREFDDHPEHPVVDLLASQKTITMMGGTMRLGAYTCRLEEGTKVAETYGVNQISERHRHRFEVNNHYRPHFEEHGLKLAGLSLDGSLVEIIELPDHPWYIGCQFHPEFKSRPLTAHPLFRGFVGAAKTFAGEHQLLRPIIAD